MTHRRTLLAAALVWALALAVPAAAPAATAAVTGDDGKAIPLTGEREVRVRTMAPEVLLRFDAEEARYVVTVEGPDGSTVGGGPQCHATADAPREPVAYAGNGVYTVRVRATGDPADEACGGVGDAQVATFTVEASTAVPRPPQPALLTRRPLEFKLLPYAFAVEVNPGAGSVELRYAREAQTGPDGSLGEDAGRASVNLRTGQATVTFAKPGTYTMVARAVAGGTPSPWSPPATVRVFSPFDFNGKPPFSDDRGPRYRIEGTVRESTATGRIRVALRRAGKGRFRRLGSVPIRRGGRFTVKFKLRGSGRYELRYRFGGSPTTAPGEVVQGFRIAPSSR